MKFIIFALLATTILTQQKTKCPKYCVNCNKLSASETLSQLKATKYACSGCLLHYADGQGGCTATTGIKDRNCLVWQNGKHCTLCKSTYALVQAGAGLAQQRKACVASKIVFCRYSVIRNGKEQCLACKKGVPSADRTRCLTGSETGLRGATLPPNCDWGAIEDQGSIVGTCFKCNPGYAVNRITGKCTATTLKGCLFLRVGDSTKCGFCDVFFEFFNKYPGVCWLGF